MACGGTSDKDCTREKELLSGQRNARIAARWDYMTNSSNSGHYETLFQLVREEIDRARSVVQGWRENDWPEGFDRRTAQIMSDRLADQI